MKTAVVILAGGTGSRLWPLSREKFPKQLCSFSSENSLIRETYVRLRKQYDNEHIFLSANIDSIEQLKDELPEILESNYILEPKRMERTAAFGLVTLILKEKGYETIVILPCDAYLSDVEEFLRILSTGQEFIEKYPDYLLLVGMNPSFASTGFGYIEMGMPVDRIGKDMIFTVQSFKEKPDVRTAEKFIADWRYLWNASWFIFSPDFMLGEYRKFVPETLEHLEKCYTLDPRSPEFLKEYSMCEEITVDISINEKSDKVVVLPASVGWSDIGSWKAVRDIDLDDNYNSFNTENIIALETKGSLIYTKNKKKTYAVLGLEDMIIVDTEDVLLAIPVDRCQEVKKLLEQADKNVK